MKLTTTQKKTIVAAFLGWTLDAFDFFLLTFLLGQIADEFHTRVPEVSYALVLTLAVRWIGALLFGWLADRYGRKPVLMLNIVSYSVIGAAAAFSPNLVVFLVLRALFGIAMGGEWGLGSALVMESIPPKARGVTSGLLQCGYPAGYLLAAIVYGLLDHQVIAGYTIGWRAMFLLSVVPAFVVLYIRSNVPESPVFTEGLKHERPGLFATLKKHWGIALYSILLMLLLNSFSHGTQDLLPRFLQAQHRFDAHTVSWIAIMVNVVAIAACIAFGWLSERIGRVTTITIGCLIAFPTIPLWAYGTTPLTLALGASLMQVAVQAVWSGIPAHLNELAPGAARATLPGFVYQAGNFLASYVGRFQTGLAESPGGSYSYALALVAGVVAVCIIIVIRFSPEKRGDVMTAGEARTQ